MSDRNNLLLIDSSIVTHTTFPPRVESVDRTGRQRVNKQRDATFGTGTASAPPENARTFNQTNMDDDSVDAAFEGDEGAFIRPARRPRI